jgi:excisionase family DNA binding protein
MDGSRKVGTGSASPCLLSLPSAARALGVSDRFLRILHERGQLRLIRLGRRVLVPASEIERLVTEGAR